MEAFDAFCAEGLRAKGPMTAEKWRSIWLYFIWKRMDLDGLHAANLPPSVTKQLKEAAGYAKALGRTEMADGIEMLRRQALDAKSARAARAKAAKAARTKTREEYGRGARLEQVTAAWADAPGVLEHLRKLSAGMLEPDGSNRTEGLSWSIWHQFGGKLGEAHAADEIHELVLEVRDSGTLRTFETRIRELSEARQALFGEGLLDVEEIWKLYVDSGLSHAELDYRSHTGIRGQLDGRAVGG